MNIFQSGLSEMLVDIMFKWKRGSQAKQVWEALWQPAFNMFLHCKTSDNLNNDDGTVQGGGVVCASQTYVTR